MQPPPPSVTLVSTSSLSSGLLVSRPMRVVLCVSHLFCAILLTQLQLTVLTNYCIVGLNIPPTPNPLASPSPFKPTDSTRLNSEVTFHPLLSVTSSSCFQLSYLNLSMLCVTGLQLPEEMPLPRFCHIWIHNTF